MTFEPPAARALTGNEPFDGVDASVLDFWRFAMSDLRTNNVRGYLAEFLASRAVGAAGARVEWDPWDVTAPDGTRIEVKSSGFLQAWAQHRLSTPRFQVKPAYGWDADSQAWSTEQSFHADVYVFALHDVRSHDDYDPLDVSQWLFYVAGREQVSQQAGASMGLATLARIAGDPVRYPGLKEAIGDAARAR